MFSDNLFRQTFEYVIHRFRWVALLFALGAASADAAFRWDAGGDGVDLFLEANWEDNLTGLDPAAGTFDPNVTVPQSPGGILIAFGSPTDFAAHFQVGTNVLVVNNGAVLSGASGAGIRSGAVNQNLGPQTTMLIEDDAEVRAAFLLELQVLMYDAAELWLSDGGNPLNNSLIELQTLDAVITFENETYADFLAEHYAKIKLRGAALEFGADPFVVEPGDNAVATDLGGVGVRLAFLGQLLSITATQQHQFADPDGNGGVAPGERVAYTTTIFNGGPGDAEMLRFVNPKPENMLLEADSLKTTPLAVNDAYDSIGNVGITVPDSEGILANDFDLGPVPVSIIAPVPGTPAATVAGGAVTLNAAGGFTYEPPVGFTGSDSFQYTIADENGAILSGVAAGANIAHVSFSVSDVIWFIDNGGLAGDGTLASPFNSLSQHNNNLDDNAGDCIFVYSGIGEYDGGIVLEPLRTLIGEGTSLPFEQACNVFIPTFSKSLPFTGGTAPVLRNTFGDAIILTSDNTVRGVDLGDSSGAGLTGFSFGFATVEEVSILTSGTAINLEMGVLEGGFNFIDKLFSPEDGIVLMDVGGTVNFGTFVIASSGAGRGIRLDGDGGSSFFSGLGDVATEEGTALDLSDCALGVMDLNSVNSIGGGNPGIQLSSVDGNLNVNGGTIANKLDTDGVRLQNTTGLISLNNMLIENIDGSGDAAPPGTVNAADNGPLSHHSQADGIHGENVLGGLALNSVTIRRISDNAINGELLSATHTPAFNLTSWVGLTL
ncbi:MAG: hypothetical protein ACI97B_002759, partial [Verrucomicrobiales bacterium]